MGQESTFVPQMTSFSTRNAGPGNEVDYWRQARREAYVSARTDPIGTGFGGEIQLGQYADFRLSTKRARTEHVRRSRNDIAQGHEDQDYLYVLFQVRGTLLVEQAGRTALASPGSLVIYDSASPFSLRAKDYYEQVVLELPADDVFARVGINRSSHLLARTFTRDGAMEPVASFFTGLARSQAGDPTGAQRLEPQASALGSSLIALLLPMHTHAEAPDAVRRSEALAYMRSHLTDPDLDAGHIATSLHLSRRTLFRLFEGTGESVMGHLRSLRLERARLMLRTQPAKPISAIALETGFSGPVQLHRAFRTTMGMTPGEYRELADRDAVLRERDSDHSP